MNNSQPKDDLRGSSVKKPEETRNSLAYYQKGSVGGTAAVANNYYHLKHGLPNSSVERDARLQDQRDHHQQRRLSCRYLCSKERWHTPAAESSRAPPPVGASAGPAPAVSSETSRDIVGDYFA